MYSASPLGPLHFSPSGVLLIHVNQDRADVSRSASRVVHRPDHSTIDAANWNEDYVLSRDRRTVVPFQDDLLRYGPIVAMHGTEPHNDQRNQGYDDPSPVQEFGAGDDQIGRASCRERGWMWG